jgi:hypothetical protein
MEQSAKQLLPKTATDNGIKIDQRNDFWLDNRYASIHEVVG